MHAPDRQPHLQAFLEALRRAFDGAETSEAERRVLGHVFGALAQTGTDSPLPGGRLPVCTHFGPALEPARAAGSELAALAAALARIEPELTWRQRSGSRLHASPGFIDNHANAMIVGPGGLEEREDVWIGLSLLAPETRYPDHSHPPEEAYLALTPGRFRHGDEDWVEPGPGGTFHNVPGIVHAMASGPEPFLALWCLHDPTAPSPVA